MNRHLIKICTRRLLELMKDHAFQEKEVTLRSGRKSNFYIDTREVTLMAEGHWLVGHLISSIITKNLYSGRELDVKAVGGMSTGADPIASAVAAISISNKDKYVNLDAFYVRKEAKKHGMQKWIEGPSHILKPGTAVVIVEDVVTTGDSTIKAIEKCRDADLNVVHVIVLVDREEDDGIFNIDRKCNVSIEAILRKRDFVKSD